MISFVQIKIAKDNFHIMEEEKPMGSKALSEIQQSILQSIHKYYIEHNGFYPAVRDIARAMDFMSRKTNEPNPGHADYHLSVLENKGYISRASGKHNAIKLTDDGKKYLKQMLGDSYTEQGDEVNQRGILPFFGYVVASKPRGKFSDFNESIDILKGLEGDDIYVMQVEGDSMINDHICNGDYAIIKSIQECKNGDIVIALRNDQGLNNVTLKKFYDDDDRVRLQPSNDKMKPILIDKQEWKKQWRIQGKVIGIVRKNVDA